MMKSLWFVGGVVTATLVVQSHGYPIRGHDSGTCREYFPEGGACSDYIGGLHVLEFDDYKLEEWDANVKGILAGLRSQTQAIAVEDCLQAMVKTLCLSWFPPCDENNEPRQICNSVCTYLRDDVCSSAFAIIKNVGLGERVPSCDGIIGDPAGSEAFVYWEYYNAWKDLRTFPTIEESPNCADLSVSKSAKCQKKKCLYPLAEYRIPKFKNPADGKPEWKNPNYTEYCKNSVHESPDDFDCEQCESFCSFPCDPYPEVYSKLEYELLHTITYLPGFISLPLNTLVLGVEIKKLQAMKKWDFTDLFILLSASFSLILFTMEPLPSALLGKELRCNGQEVYNWEYDLQQEHSVCGYGKLRLHLMQALLCCVVGTLYKVYRQLKASLAMSRYTPSVATRFFFAFLVLLVPSSLACFTIALDSDQLYEMSRSYRISLDEHSISESLHTANRLRYAFTCGPRFANETIEMGIIHLPLLLAGVVSVILSAMLLHIVFFKMGAGRTASTYTKKSSSTQSKNTALAKLAMNMIRFASVTTLLVLINATATFMFVPQSRTFGAELDDWQSCATTGIDYRRARGPDGTLALELDAYTNDNMTTLDDFLNHCGRFDDFKPSVILLCLIALSNGLPPVAFGFVFALPALKQLRAMLRNKLSKIVPTGMSAASSASSAET